MAGRKRREGPVNYFELPRKQLQFLCKKYGYPANRTNLLMAQFLTSHLNSDEYLNRDKSQPSPAVKTRFQCHDEELITDNILSTISESKPANVETDGRNLLQQFIDIDAAHTVCPLEASKFAEKSLGGTNEEASADSSLMATLMSQPAKVEAEGSRVSDEVLAPQTDCPLGASKLPETDPGHINEETTTDNILCVTPESAPADVETDTSMLSYDFSHAAHRYCPLEASKSAGTLHGQINQSKTLDMLIVQAETVKEMDVERTAETVAYVSTESPPASDGLARSEEKATLSFLDIDFTDIKVQDAGREPSRTEPEMELKNCSEKIMADKPTPLSPLDSNRMAMDKAFDSPTHITPSKSVGILEVIREAEGKENTNGLSLFGKENEWSRRQELHKTPLTGKSKEKALRTAEKQASNLREQLLKKRRGMMTKEENDGYISS